MLKLTRRLPASVYSVCLLSTLLTGFSTGAAMASPLFSSTDQLTIGLEADFGTMFREKSKDKRFTGRLTYKALDSVISLPVEIEVRGNFRLENCRIPGLRVHLPDDVAGLFADQTKLKLVNQCKPASDAFQDYLLQEYAIYRAFNLLTDNSFKTRLAMIHYSDPGNQQSWANYGFFIEDKKKAGERLGMTTVDDSRIPRSDLEAASTNLLTLFMYMIGNADFSLIKGPGDDPCCHNAKLLQSDRGKVPIPYDFDMTGMINASYAAPPAGLRIKKVTQRVYRGFCDNNAHIPISIRRLQNNREALYATFADSRISPKAVKRMHRYLDQFYRVLESPKQVERRITTRCR